MRETQIGGMKHKEINEAALAQLIPAFYARVREDPLIGPIFDGAVGQWPEHLEKLQAFWSSVMLKSGRYDGRPLPVHIELGDVVTREAFQRWLALWRETTSELLEPAPAAAMQDKAERIAESLALGIDFYRERRLDVGA